MRIIILVFLYFFKAYFGGQGSCGGIWSNGIACCYFRLRLVLGLRIFGRDGLNWLRDGGLLLMELFGDLKRLIF